VNLVAVVLNWNGGADTLAALASLDGIPAICIDNGSMDGSDELVAERFPGVELIRTGANLGFAGGNNVGIARALEFGAVRRRVVQRAARLLGPDRDRWAGRAP
jgi:GT2 family glycosyltransferase